MRVGNKWTARLCRAVVASAAVAAMLACDLVFVTARNLRYAETVWYWDKTSNVVWRMLDATGWYHVSSDLGFHQLPQLRRGYRPSRVVALPPRVEGVLPEQPGQAAEAWIVAELLWGVGAIKFERVSGPPGARTRTFWEPHLGLDVYAPIAVRLSWRRCALALAGGYLMAVLLPAIQHKALTYWRRRSQRCASCGYPLGVATHTCPECGMALQERRAPDQPASPEPPRMT